MVNYNKILLKKMDDADFKQEEFYEILSLIKNLDNIEKQKRKLKKEKKKAFEEYCSVYHISKIGSSLRISAENRMDEVYIKKDIQLFEEKLNTKFEILSIISKNKSDSNIKYHKKMLKKSNEEKEKIKANIKYQWDQECMTRKCAPYPRQQMNEEMYYKNRHKLERVDLTKTTKEILKHEYYIRFYSQNKSR